MNEPDPIEYVHTTVNLDGIGPIECWASFVILASGKVYMGHAQFDYPGPTHGPKDPETGVRPVLRRAMTLDDAKPIRDALEAELKEFLKP